MLGQTLKDNELEQELARTINDINNLDENATLEQITQLEEKLEVLQEIMQLEQEIAELEENDQPLQIANLDEIDEQKSPFKLSKAADVKNSPLKTKYKVMSDLPKPEFLEKLNKVNTPTSNAVLTWLKEPYSYVVSRPYKENHPSFFPLVPATSLYESYNELEINGKNHGKKAGTIYNGLQKVSRLLEDTLKVEILDEPIKEIYQQTQALLIVSHNAFCTALKKVPQETKAHLKKHANLDVDVLENKNLTPTKQQCIKEVFNFTPEKVPGDNTPEEKSTPKTLTEENKKSVEILKKVKKGLFN